MTTSTIYSTAFKSNGRTNEFYFTGHKNKQLPELLNLSALDSGNIKSGSNKYVSSPKTGNSKPKT